MSMVDADGDGPLIDVQPKAGSGGTVGEGVRLSVIGESCVRCIEPATESDRGVEAGCGDDAARPSCDGSMRETECAEDRRPPSGTCDGGAAERGSYRQDIGEEGSDSEECI